MINRGRAWTWAAIYRGQSGQWAQLLHRLAGLGVLLFLLLHIADVALLGWGPGVYDEILKFYHQPVGVALQVGLLAAVLFHALNGIRVTLLDFTNWAVERQRGLFWAVVITFVVLFVPTVVIMVRNIFG